MEIELADGTVLDAPDGLTPEQIKGIVQKHSHPKDPAPNPQYEEPDARPDTIGALSPQQARHGAMVGDEERYGATPGRAFMRNVAPGYDYVAAGGQYLRHRGVLPGDDSDRVPGEPPTWDAELNTQRALGDQAERENPGAATSGTILQAAITPWKAGAALWPRLQRMAQAAGLAGVTEGSKGRDGMAAAGTAALTAGVGEAGGKLLGLMGRGGKAVADRAATAALQPSEGEAQLLRERFGTPAEAGARVRDMKMGSGKSMLPNLASHETRLANTTGEMDRVGKMRASLLRDAHMRGARMDAEGLAKEVQALRAETVASPETTVLKGRAPAESVDASMDRFAQQYERPAQVKLDANGEPMIARPEQYVGAGGVYESDPTKMGKGVQWEGRLEGSGPQPHGENMPPGKRRALRVEDYRPREEPFGSTPDSTTRPRPNNGWYAMIDPAKPMTVEEADRLRRALDKDVYESVAGAQKVEWALNDPTIQFKKKLADLLRRKVNEQVEDKLGQAYGYEGIQKWQGANEAYGDAATLEPLLRQTANRAAGGFLPHTRAGVMRLLPGLSYLPQGTSAVAGVAEKAGKLGDLAASSRVAKMLALMAAKQPNPEETP